MFFKLTDEQQMLRDMVRDFAIKEIAPGVEEREEKKEFPAEIIAKAAELGLCGVAVDEKYGGAGFDTISACLALLEIASVCPSTSITLSVTNAAYCWPVEQFGTESQKERFLRPIASGEQIGAFCLSEPNTGSDAANLIVKAEEDGDDFLIEGTKAWVTNGGIAGAYLVMAVTGQKNGRKEISAFLVPADATGLEIGKTEKKMGLNASKTTQIVFDKCRVGRDQMLGERGDGLKIALATLDQSRIGVAAQAVGIAKGALREAVKYAQERETFGKPLAKHQAIQFMISDMATETEAAELLTLRAAWMLDQKVPYSKESSMAKLFASETAKKTTDMAVQIHGAYGYSREYAVERLFRDARVTTIYEGTSEIQKIVISRNMMKNIR